MRKDNYEPEEWDKIIERLKKLSFEEILEIAAEGSLDFYGKGSKHDYIYAMDEIDKEILLKKLEEIEKRTHN